MSTQFRFRRGSSAQHATFTGALSELTHNTTTNRMHLHDGNTVGGFPMARLDEVGGGIVMGVVDGVGITVDITDPKNPIVRLSAASQASLAKADTAVQSVNGKTGTAITLTANDVGAAGTAVATTSANGLMAASDKTKLNGIATGATANQTDAFLRSRANHTGTQEIDTVSGLQAALDASEKTASKNIANGYAGLGSDGKIPQGLLPSIALMDVFEVASQAAMLALDAQTGDIAIRTDLNKTFVLGASPASTLANWKELRTPTDTVTSVASLVGSISASSLKTALSFVKGDVGLGNVDNTSDADKPVSTATQNALNLKANTVHTHTATQISDSSVVGRAVLVAASAADARTAIGAGTSNLTIGATSTTAAAGDHTHGAATTAANGFMSAADKSKLDGIAVQATKNDTDANLRDRSTHTGTQAMSTVAGLEASLAQKMQYETTVDLGTIA